MQQLRVDTRPIIFNREAGESVIPYHLIIIEQVECVVFGVRSSNQRHRTLQSIRFTHGGDGLTMWCEAVIRDWIVLKGWEVSFEQGPGS